MDYGEVAGPSTEWIIGRHLSGAVVGLRGGFRALSYDLYTGWPVSKPDGMPVSDATFGFNASLSF
jgi:hemolysin activation/secretion protein